MKGLLVTILLGILEISAVMAGDDQLFADQPINVPAIRREEIQAEVLVDAERLELVTPAPETHAEAI